MGCLFGKHSPAEAHSDEDMTNQPPKQYPWDKPQDIDPKDYMFTKLKGETVGKLPGTVNGKQFTIQDCEGCDIYVFDHIAMIYVDDCTDCRIFLGPISSSVFIRDCKNCKFMVACQQFRTRDCQKLEVFLSCVTQPIIEASTGVKFGCFQWNYPELEEQFRKAGISPYNNNWSNIHDFTPVSDEINYTLISPDANIDEHFPKPTSEELSSVLISTDNCPVPTTLGKRPKPSEQSCLVVFFSDGNAQDRAKKFVMEMRDNHKTCTLVQSKEVVIPEQDGLRIFGTDSYGSALKQGAAIGFEYNGDDVCQACQDTGVAVSQGSTGVMFVSASPAAAQAQIENFYNFVEMQMGV